MANSFATLSYNLFGYFPAPMVFGGVADRLYPNNSNLSMRYAMASLTYSTILAIFFFMIASLINIKRTKVDPNLAFIDKDTLNSKFTSKQLEAIPEIPSNQQSPDQELSPKH